MCSLCSKQLATQPAFVKHLGTHRDGKGDKPEYAARRDHERRHFAPADDGGGECLPCGAAGAGGEAAAASAAAAALAAAEARLACIDGRLRAAEAGVRAAQRALLLPAVEGAAGGGATLQELLDDAARG